MAHRTVREVMTTEVITVSADTPFKDLSPCWRSATSARCPCSTAAAA